MFSYPGGIRIIAIIPSLLKVHKNKGPYTLVNINVFPL